MEFKFYVPTLSPFLRPILTVFFSKTGETGDISCVLIQPLYLSYLCDPLSVDVKLFSIPNILENCFNDFYSKNYF